MAPELKNHKISIVIVTYNQLEFTKQCIDSIYKFTRETDYEIIIVDNNSEDGTADYLKSLCTRNEKVPVELIFNKYNLGFPAGCNQGIKASSSEYVLFLNNDTVVTYNWLKNLQICISSSQYIGAVGPVTNYCSNYQAMDVNYNNMDEMQLFARQHNISDKNMWEERLNLVGFCILIKRKVLDEVGYFDEIFSPGNYEDDDLSMRIIKSGHKMILCRDTFIHHYGDKSFKKNLSGFIELLEINSRKFENKWKFRRDRSLVIRNEMIRVISASINDSLNFLEIGCGCGATLLKIKNIFKNANLYGIEPNPAAADIAGIFSKVTVAEAESFTFNYPVKFFDYILLPDVLEHLKDPWSFLAKIKEFLADNGSILMNIHNAMHISVIRQLLNGTWGYSKTGVLDREHLRFFTLADAINMILANNLKIINIIQKSIKLSEDENALISNLGNLDGIDMNILQQVRAYKYIIEVKKQS